MENTITKADIRISVVLFFGGWLEMFRKWLIDEISSQEESGQLLAWLEDHDLTPTFGAIYFALTNTQMLEAVLEGLTSDEQLMRTAERNRSRAFRLGLEWDATEQLNPDRDFVVTLRHRFNDRFKSFRNYTVENFADENEQMASAIFFSKDFSQLVFVISCFGQLEVFKIWLENYRDWHPSTAAFVAVVLYEVGDA